MDYDFTKETTEKLLIKKALKDKKYLNRLSQTIVNDKGKYDIRWLGANSENGILLRLIVAFYNKYHEIPSNIYIQGLIKKFCSDNPSTKSADLNSRLAEINSIDIDIGSEAVVKNVEKLVMDTAFYYAVSDNIEQITKNGNVEDCLERFRKVQKLNFDGDDIGMTYFDKEDSDKFWEYVTNPESKISSGWKSLDFYTNNGIPKDGKFLGLFLAQSGLGKSLFLSNMAVNFLRQNLTVGVISLEMSEHVYASRFTAHISTDDINKLKDTHESSRKKIDDFYLQYPKAQLYIKEYPPRSIRSIDIDAYLDTLKDRGIKLDVLIVDYLNLVLPNKKADNMFESGMHVSEELRALSYKWQIPIMSAVQANSEGMGNENIDMENVSQSRGIVFTADFIAALFEKDNDREQGMLNLRIVKNRLGGQVGKIMKFRKNRNNLVVTDQTYTETEISRSEADEILDNLGELSSMSTAIDQF